MPSIILEGIGYLILLALGLVMALGATPLIKAETKWLGTKKYLSGAAGRNVKTGLLASSVASAWTWAAILLPIFDSCLSVWDERAFLVRCERQCMTF